jgi:hypothetical protein
MSNSSPKKKKMQSLSATLALTLHIGKPNTLLDFYSIPMIRLAALFSDDRVE